MSTFEGITAGAGACDSATSFVPLCYEDLAFRCLDSCSYPSFLGLEVEKYGEILVENIPLSDSLPISSQLVIAPDFQDGVGFIEATHPVTQENKSSFVSVLECFEAANCSSIVACVNRDNTEMKNIISSLISTGFHLTPSPSPSTHFWLNMDI